jgi:hypothetical protein
MHHDRMKLACARLPILTLLAAALAACGGNVIVEDPPKTTTDPSDCTDLETLCGNECADLQSDPNHCGDCSIACASGPCLNGNCLNGTPTTGGTTSGTECPAGYYMCASGCVDIYNDATNCGYCNHICAPGEACVDAFCVSSPGSCVTCAEVITPGANPNDWPPCPGDSAQLYDELINCVCADQCAFLCSDNVCAGSDITEACQNCVADPNGCGNEFNECANDF